MLYVAQVFRPARYDAGLVLGLVLVLVLVLVLGRAGFKVGVVPPLTKRLILTPSVSLSLAPSSLRVPPASSAGRVRGGATARDRRAGVPRAGTPSSSCTRGPRS